VRRNILHKIIKDINKYCTSFEQICEALILHPQEWTTGWDNYSSTAYAIKKDRVVVYDDLKAIMMKVSFALFMKQISH